MAIGNDNTPEVDNCENKNIIVQLKKQLREEESKSFKHGRSRQILQSRYEKTTSLLKEQRTALNQEKKKNYDLEQGNQFLETEILSLQNKLKEIKDQLADALSLYETTVNHNGVLKRKVEKARSETLVEHQKAEREMMNAHQLASRWRHTVDELQRYTGEENLILLRSIELDDARRKLVVAIERASVEVNNTDLEMNTNQKHDNTSKNSEKSCLSLGWLWKLCSHICRRKHKVRKYAEEARKLLREDVQKLRSTIEKKSSDVLHLEESLRKVRHTVEELENQLQEEEHKKMLASNVVDDDGIEKTQVGTTKESKKKVRGKRLRRLIRFKDSEDDNKSAKK